MAEEAGFEPTNNGVKVRCLNHLATLLCQIGSKTLKITKKKEKLAVEFQFLGFRGRSNK